MTNSADLFRLDGKVALVTGGAGVIGRAISRGLADVGARVVVAARDLARCEAVAASIRDAGGDASALSLDLATEASIESAVARTGGVDILVNNAISQYPGHVESYPTSDWEKSMAVDATGYFRVTQLCLNSMLERGGGNIITIASILGIVAPEERLYPARGISGFRPSYFYTKAGVVGFTRFLATAYAERNIRANCISPGGVESDPPRKDAQGFVDRVPMKRLARADEVVGATIYLASEASSYVTGHNLVVDGGYTAW